MSCRDPRLYEEMRRVAAEARRVLVPGGILAWIIADEYRGGVYTPAGFRLLTVLSEAFEPIDTVVLVRHHDRSASPMWEHRARRFNFYLRGFKFVFILRKPVGESGGWTWRKRRSGRVARRGRSWRAYESGFGRWQFAGGIESKSTWAAIGFHGEAATGIGSSRRSGPCKVGSRCSSFRALVTSGIRRVSLVGRRGPRVGDGSDRGSRSLPWTVSNPRPS